MYLLKVESGNGYEYFQLPKNFKKELCTEGFSTYCKYPKLILKDEKEWMKFCPSGLENTGGDNGLFIYSLPMKAKAGVSIEGTDIAIEIPTFKVITYVEDENNPSPTRCIVFDGKAYLIKENGKTIETF